MKGRTANLLLAAAATAAVLFAAELAVRFLWSRAPSDAGATDTLPVRQIADREILYRLVPGTSGYYGGTRVRINSSGLRGPDYPPRAAGGTGRLLVLGDSMVFGVGLSEEATIPARLAAALSGSATPAEAINAGIFGYNLAQEVALLRDVGLSYSPGAVIACFVHNDIENWGLGDGGAVPPIRSGRFDPPPPDAWSSRLADFMLPGSFDAERLNLLPAGEAVGLRGRLASASRLYLFTYLRLRTHSWNLTAGERREDLVDARTCQAERLVWSPIRQGYRQMRRMSEAAGARFGAVILGGLLWEGAPLERLRRILEQEEIPFLDLTPVWFSPERYAADYSLGWDPHPNSTAADLAATLMAGFVKGAALLERRAVAGQAADRSPDWSMPSHPGLDGRLRAWRSRQQARVREDDQRWSELLAEIDPVVEPGAETGSGITRQALHGFWEADPALPPPSGQPGRGRWLSDRGAVLLPGIGSGAILSIELAGPADPAAIGRAARILNVSITAPPDRCEPWEAALPIAPAGAREPILLQLPVPEALASARLLEVELSVDRPVTAAYLSGQDSSAPGVDRRLLSVFVRRVALAAGPSTGARR